MKKEHFFDKPGNVTRLLRVFFAALILLLFIDLFIHKHVHYPWEEWPGFFAVFGLVACVLLVLLAKYILRPFVKRRENYYD